MKARDLDKKFDQGDEDVLDSFDLEKATRPNHDPKRVNVDFPSWMVQSLDKEASRLGVTRQSLIKMWVADKLEVRSHI
jgi:hypothetical protein